MQKKAKICIIENLFCSRGPRNPTDLNPTDLIANCILLTVTRYRQRLAAAAEMQQQFRGTVGLSMARRVLAREGLDQACSSCDDRHGPSYDAAAKFAATRATSSRVPGAYDTPNEETEETMESESQVSVQEGVATHENVEIECNFWFLWFGALVCIWGLAF